MIIQVLCVVGAIIVISFVRKESWQKGFRAGFERGLSHRLAELQEKNNEEKSSDCRS